MHDLIVYGCLCVCVCVCFILPLESLRNFKQTWYTHDLQSKKCKFLMFLGWRRKGVKYIFNRFFVNARPYSLIVLDYHKPPFVHRALYIYICMCFMFHSISGKPEEILKKLVIHMTCSLQKHCGVRHP